jgi:restriction system protein
VDLKVTSVIQPQSSCPFADAKQKVYGLGYHLLVFVYAKTDSAADAMATLDIQHTLFINAAFTADRQTTTGLAEILRRGGNVDDIDAFLEERSLPLDEIGRRSLAQQILSEPPRIGHLTISNALQWRLQYGHAIQSAAPSSSEVEDLRG